MIDLHTYLKTRPELTGAGLARSAGITKAYLYRLLAGGENPSLDVLARLADALGVRSVHLRHDGVVLVDV